MQGAEFDASLVLTEHWRAQLSSAWTDSEYCSYRNAPCPLEQIGGPRTVCDLSGRPLSSTPRWVFSGGTKYSHPLRIADIFGEGYARADFTVRTHVYGEPTDSRYGVIDGYGLIVGTPSDPRTYGVTLRARF